MQSLKEHVHKESKLESLDEIQQLEKLIGQLKTLHSEVGQLGKKSPNDGINKFKLGMINKVISRANKFLGEDYTPYDDFDEFIEEDVPSNSDVTFVLLQYLEEAERYRSNHVDQEMGRYYYKVSGKLTDVRAAPPSWSKK